MKYSFQQSLVWGVNSAWLPVKIQVQKPQSIAAAGTGPSFLVPMATHSAALKKPLPNICSHM